MAGAQIEFLMTPFVDGSGDPLDGGTVEFFIATTSTPVDVYADFNLSTNLGSIVTLDSSGTRLCFADGDNFLKIVVKDSAGTPLYTRDGLSYRGGLTDAGLYYLLDGSNPLNGDMNVNGFDLINTGTINVGIGKSVHINHGDTYTPLVTDMLVMGDPNGLYRNLTLTGDLFWYKDATELLRLDDSLFRVSVNQEVTGTGSYGGNLDMNSNKITEVAAGTVPTDAINKGQLDATDSNVSDLQDELDTTQTGAGLNTDGTYTPDPGTTYIPGATSLKNADSLLDAAVKAINDARGAANGIAELDATGVLKASQIPIELMSFLGNWDAATNSPTLTDGIGNQGDTYRCSVAGTQDFGSGSLTFQVGDWVYYTGTVWQKGDNIDQVISVFGRLGAIVAQASDYDASQVDNDSVVTGLFVDDALNTLDTDVTNANNNANSRVLKSGDTMTGDGMIILGSGTPENNEAAKYNQVDLRVLKSGDTMTGDGMIVLGSGTPENNEAAKYNQVDLRVLKAGDTMTGDGMIVLGSGTPTGAEAAKYSQVDLRVLKAGDTMTGTGMITLGSGTPAGAQAAKFSQIPTNNNQLTNGAGYQNATQVQDAIDASPAAPVYGEMTFANTGSETTSTISGTGVGKNGAKIHAWAGFGSAISRMTATMGVSIDGTMSLHTPGVGDDAAAFSGGFGTLTDGTLTLRFDITKINDNQITVKYSETGANTNVIDLMVSVVPG